MKKMYPLNIFFFILLSTCQTGNALEISQFPKWINALSLNLSRTLQTEVKIANIHIADRVRKGEYFTFSLKGEGRLRDIPDPFKKRHEMFSSRDWEERLEYAADKHGASSFTYEKANYLCNIYVEVDSDCDDERTGHIPGKFWFEFYCREN